MSYIKQLIPQSLKFTPATPGVNWQRVETLVHGPGAGRMHDSESNSALFACLNAIAWSYPEPPLVVYRRDSAGKSRQLQNHPLQELLNAPTPGGELSIEEIRFWTAWAKHVDGNAYWLKVRSGDALTGNVVQLWPISPTLMRPVTARDSGDWISYYEYQRAPGVFDRVPVGNVIHFRLGLDDKDMRKGLAPLKALVRQISTDEEADKFVDALLKNYAVPGLVVVPTNGMSLDEDDADRLTDRLRRKFGGDGRGNIAVLSKETTVHQFGFSPKDLDMSILHRIPEERISAVTGVPAIVAGLGAGLDRATYSNFREAREMFTETKLIPQWGADAAKLNVSLKPDFTSDANVVVGHDITNVRALQEDEDKKYTRLQAATGKPWMTRNEARTDTGLDPIEGWDDADIKPPEPKPAPVTPQQPQDQEEDSDVQKELRTWRVWAIRRAAARKSLEGFRCEFVPQVRQDAIQARLNDARTEADVKAAFDEPQPPDLAAELARASDLLEKALRA